MDCVLLAQRESAKEGTAREIEQNTIDFYLHMVLTPFIFQVLDKVLPVKTGMEPLVLCPDW